MTHILLGLGTLVAMLIATRVTLTHARRPDGLINQFGKAQAVLPDGRTVFPDPQRPGGMVDQYGMPVPPPAEEKPLWLIWGQMFLVAELAALLLVGILTGGFGLLALLGW